MTNCFDDACSREVFQSVPVRVRAFSAGLQINRYWQGSSTGCFRRAIIKFPRELVFQHELNGRFRESRAAASSIGQWQLGADVTL